MRRALIVAGIVVLAACSSSHHKAQAPPTTTSTSPSSPSTPSTASTIPAPSTTGSPSTGSRPPSTTPPATNPSGNTSVTISGFSGPPSPVECNAPTTIELKWTSSGATNVEMRIDGGPVFTRYPNGKHDEFLPLACDGHAHTYALTATAPGVSASRSITITSKPL